MSDKKKDLEKLGEKFKVQRKSYIDEVADRSRDKSDKNKKVTLSLPHDVIETLWVIKGRKRYPSVSSIVSEAVREFAKKLGV